MTNWMIIYKGWTFHYIGFNYWRGISPNKNFNFKIKFPGGLKELKERVDLWRSVIDNDDY